jgi:aryl-alcohol dehydrogenase-like predicted oxidoreductase
MNTEFRVPRRRWGKSNIEIPVIPFGTQGFGNHFGFVSDDNACKLIRRAVDIGVNHFDCALCYGDSMRKLGLAIKTGVIERDEVIISGRVCCHGRDDIDYSAEHAFSDVKRQLEFLGMDYFDAMFIHDPVQIEPTLAKDGTLSGLLKAKSQGLVRNVGYGMRPHDFHLKAIETGDIDVLLTFNDYNLLRQTAADDILPAAAAGDIGVLNGWSIMRGILTGIDLSSHDKSKSDVARAIKMRQWCIEESVSLLAVALQFCLREERIHGNPIGNLNIGQLEMNAHAVSEPLPPDIIQRFAAQNF